MLGYYIVKLFSKLMCVSPRWLRNILAKILGDIACVVTPKWRMKMAKANVKECLGVDDERATIIAEDSMRRFGRMVIEVLRFPCLTSENIDEIVKIDGLEYLEDAYNLFKEMPDSRTAIEKTMSVLAYLERYAGLQQFYDGLKNKEEFSEHFLNVMGKYNELAIYMLTNYLRIAI